MAKRIQNRGGLAPNRYLSKDQVAQLRRYIKSCADQARANGSMRDIVNEMIVKLLLGSGLRARELCFLQMRDLPHCHSKNVLYIRDGKGHISRTVEISTALADKLTHFVKTYRKGSKPGSAVIPSEKGYRVIRYTIYRKAKSDGRLLVENRTEYSSRITYASLYGRLKLIGIKSGIGRLTPHMLRHTHLCLLYGVKEDLRFVQDQAGHASPVTTAIYARTSPESRRRQIEALELC